jgi:hypothetical protein
MAGLAVGNVSDGAGVHDNEIRIEMGVAFFQRLPTKTRADGRASLRPRRVQIHQAGRAGETVLSPARCVNQDHTAPALEKRLAPHDEVAHDLAQDPSELPLRVDGEPEAEKGEDDVGLERVFRDLFPITDVNENYSLEFVKCAIGEPKYTVEECIERDMTYSAPLKATLHVSTTGTDADWVVKLIDVYPGGFPNPDPNPDRSETWTAISNSRILPLKRYLHCRLTKFFGSIFCSKDRTRINHFIVLMGICTRLSSFIVATPIKNLRA